MRGVYEKVPGSGVWWIRWTDKEGKLHREKVGRKGDAKTLVDARRTDVVTNKKLPVQFREPVLFESLCNDALEFSKAVNDIKTSYDLELKIVRFKKVFGHRNSLTIVRQELLRWLEGESASHEWKPATRNRYQAALSLIFRVAVDNGRLETNPARNIRRKVEDNGRIRFLSAVEEACLRDVIQSRFPAFLDHFDLSLNTGMRAGEQYSLRWEQIDFDRRSLTLPRTKNGRVRHLPLNRTAIEALNRLRNDGPWVFPSARTRGSLQGARGWFKSAVQEAKLENYTWHCNRHTFASRLIMAGVDIRTVGELLGHLNLQMTMRYAHLAENHKAEAVSRLVAPTLTPELTPADSAKNCELEIDAKALIQ
jgi:integrase